VTYGTPDLRGWGQGGGDEEANNEENRAAPEPPSRTARGRFTTLRPMPRRDGPAQEWAGRPFNPAGAPGVSTHGVPVTEAGALFKRQAAPDPSPLSTSSADAVDSITGTCPRRRGEKGASVNFRQRGSHFGRRGLGPAAGLDVELVLDAAGMKSPRVQAPVLTAHQARALVQVNRTGGDRRGAPRWPFRSDHLRPLDISSHLDRLHAPDYSPALLLDRPVRGRTAPPSPRDGSPSRPHGSGCQATFYTSCCAGAVRVARSSGTTVTGTGEGAPPTHQAGRKAPLSSGGEKEAAGDSGLPEGLLKSGWASEDVARPVPLAAWPLHHLILGDPEEERSSSSPPRLADLDVRPRPGGPHG